MTWRSIKDDPSPKDGTRILLYRPTCLHSKVVAGYWFDDRYAKRPRPYWTHDREQIWGVKDARDNQPTHWMSLPEPPDVFVKGEGE